MKLSVFGTGYLGATHAACRADLGHGVNGGSLLGARVGVLSSAFKPDSDDVRDFPAFNIAGQLQLQGAAVSVFDPKANDNSPKLFPTLRYTDSAAEAMRGANIVLILTEWTQFREADPRDFDSVVRAKIILDGRNCLDTHRWANAGWTFRGAGRAAA